MHRETVQTEDEALTFIENNGLVTLFPIRGTSFPNLYASVAGRNKQEKLERTWAWADSLSQQKRIFYGKAIRKQVTLISLELFPCVFRTLHNEATLSKKAKEMLNLLRKHGAMPTNDLRKQVSLTGREQRSQFAKALDELSHNMLVAVVNREKSPRMTYTWDLIERWMPSELLTKAQKTNESVAKGVICAKLLKNKAARSIGEIDKLLGWHR